MSQQKKKNWTRTAAKIIVVLIVLDALVYVGADQPLHRLLAREQQHFTATRMQWLRQRTALDRIETRDAALPADQEQIQSFFKRHAPSRHQAFSRAAGLIQTLTARSGVQLAGIKYSLEKAHSDPLEHLGLDATVQGPFPNLINFAHGLETASDFIVVRGFTFAPGDQGVLALHLKADLYMAP